MIGTLAERANLVPGISGLSLYLPPYRVQLEQWCDWNDQSWDKVRNVVGRSFRMRGPAQSVYTMAANAVWRLIRDYDIDPRDVGYLALGTESSSDNSAGAIIVKGMINDALVANGKPELARDCEVPEFKHACLGAMYGVKSALRYLSSDGAGRKAIVVGADIAEYRRGSSGEPTQGAGAVAMLLESDPKLLTIDLAGAGSDSDYRAVDFRKPFARFRDQPKRDDGQMQDLPVFNGRYSTSCYIDATHHAVMNMLAKRDGANLAYFDEVDSVFMHRPYQQMPAIGWVMTYLFALAADVNGGKEILRELSVATGVDYDALVAELSAPSPFRGQGVSVSEETSDLFPLSGQVRRHLRKTETWATLVEKKLGLGENAMRDLGNLYTAALPAWIASGFVEAHDDDLRVAGQEWLALGYGSGDAAEALPMRVADGWREAASRINFTEALADPIDLDQHQYEALHDGRAATLSPPQASDEFVVDRVGTTAGPDVADLGIEFYRYVEAAQA
nr:hypothetical protein [Homoserinimonas sp. OAct 916]